MSAASPSSARSLPAPSGDHAHVVLDLGDSPMDGILISNPTTAAARIRVLGVRIVAPRERDIHLLKVAFRKTGVLSSAAISGAYLISDNKVIAPYRSIASDTISFTDLDWEVGRGEARTLWLAIDPAPGIPAGNGAVFSLAAAEDIVFEYDNRARFSPHGSFPLSGKRFTATAVSNPDLATLSVESLPIGAVVVPGTTDNIIGSWSVSISNGKAMLKGLRLRALGDADGEAVERIRLFLDDREIAGPIPSIGDDGTVWFDLSATPAPLRAGQTRIDVRADITGSPGDELQMVIHAPYDIDVADAQYGVSIPGQVNEGSALTIQAGTLIIRPL